MSHPAVKHPNQLVRKRHSGFNEWLATKLGEVLGSIWFFYLCLALDLAELPAVASQHSVELWVTYVAQTVIQLLALPILQVYQNLITAHTQAKADADHEALSSIHEHVDHIEVTADAILKAINKGRNNVK